RNRCRMWSGGRRPEEVRKAGPVTVTVAKEARVHSVRSYDLGLGRPWVRGHQAITRRVEEDRRRTSGGERLEESRILTEHGRISVGGRSDGYRALGVGMSEDGAAVRREFLNRGSRGGLNEYVLEATRVWAGEAHDHDVEVCCDS